VKKYLKEGGTPKQQIKVDNYIIDFDEDGNLKQVYCDKNEAIWFADTGWYFI
jgi:hypothetical protein